MLNRFRPLAALAVALAVAGSAAAQDGAEAKRPLVLAGGDVAGSYFAVGGAVCRMVSRERERHGLRCLVEPTAGSAANLAALRAGDVDLALVQSRQHRDAWTGDGASGQAGPFAALRSLASLHGEAVVLVAAKPAKIAKLADLKGKKVNFGRPNSFQRLMAESVLAVAGIDAKGWEAPLEMDLAQQTDALCEGRLDAGFYSGLHPMPLVTRALAECDVEIVDLKELTAARRQDRTPFLAVRSLPASAYGLDADLRTLSMKATLVTTDRLPDEAAYQVVRALAEDFASFRAMHPVLDEIDRKALPGEALAAPLHPGAQRYYGEAGLLR